MPKALKPFPSVRLYSAFRIAAIYFVISFIWILGSDKISVQFSSTLSEHALFQTLKGWFFTSTSTVILYLLVRSQLNQQKEVFRNYLAKQKQLSTVVQNLPNVVLLLFDAKGVVLLKEGNKYILNNVSTAFLSPEQYEKHLKQEIETVLKGNRITLEMRADKRVYEWKIEALYNSRNKVYAAIAIVVDITELKNTAINLKAAKKKAEESEALKTAFLANLSHEVRTPLNSIMGFSELIAQYGDEQEDTKHFSQIIRKSSEQLTNLIDNLLEVSKIQIGQMQLENSVFSINEMIRNLVETHAFNSSVKISYELELPDEQDAVQTDARKVHQVFQKLIGNALKFTVEGSVKLWYKTEKNAVVFAVSDTGPGVPQEKRSIVFQPFRQADDTDTREFGGAGLGLTIAKGLVEILGGTIWFDTEIEKGTTFFFRIPVKFRHSKDERKPEIEKKVYSTSDKILVVEDDPINLELVETILKSLGAEVLTAENAFIALEICETEVPNLVLVDIQLPVMNGLELTKTLKSKYPQLKIIAQTAFSSYEDKQACLKAGCDDYLTKPIEPQKLLRAIAEHLT